jgi:dihydrolipoamide dehydrogenase
MAEQEGGKMRQAPLVVLGGGPGGYAAAFAVADAGHEVLVVDDGDGPGGTCLRSGCIPSKALLHVARVISESAEVAKAGVMLGSPEIDLDRLRAWKDEVVLALGGGVTQLAAARSVEWIQAEACLRDRRTLELLTKTGEKSLLGFEQLVLATGSSPLWPESLGPLSPLVMDSTAALELPDIPDRLLVVGGGYIGLELGTVYSALGSRVSVVEMTGGLLAGADRDLVRPLARRLESRFESIRLNTSVESLLPESDVVTAVLVGSDGTRETMVYDRVLVAVGRQPNSNGLGLLEAGVEVDERGRVLVDSDGRTSTSNILAIGDLCAGPMLAHRATADARRVVATLCGRTNDGEDRDSLVVPAVVFTDPELAWCGLTETEARDSGREITVSRVPWLASGRAHSMSRTDGLTKLVLEPGSGRILGAGIVGVGAGELIAEAVLAMSAGLTASQLATAIHAHPTLSETLAEAAEHSEGRAIHLLPRRRRD